MISKLAVAFFLLLGTQMTLARELVIISDLDETLRMANVEKKVKAGLKLLTGVKPYEGLVSIFNEIKMKNPEAKFYYLSNSYPFLYDGAKWTKENNLPEGEVLQRCLKDKSDEFKPAKLKEIIAAHPEASFMLFGDNIERDPKFYRDLLTETNIDAQVYIRDARLEFPDESHLVYYQSETQLTELLDVSQETAERIHQLGFNKLVPKFLLKNLKKRLIKSCRNSLESCRQVADKRVQEVIDLLRPDPQVALE